MEYLIIDGFSFSFHFHCKPKEEEDDDAKKKSNLFSLFYVKGWKSLWVLRITYGYMATGKRIWVKTFFKAFCIQVLGGNETKYILLRKGCGCFVFDLFVANALLMFTKRKSY